MLLSGVIALMCEVCVALCWFAAVFCLYRSCCVLLCVVFDFVVVFVDVFGVFSLRLRVLCVCCVLWCGVLCRSVRVVV